MIHRLRLLSASACLLAGILYGQDTTTKTFEVASIKPAKPGQSMIDFAVLPGGRLRVVNLTLTEIIHHAYEKKHFQLSGGPKWADSDRFNIEAKAAGEPTREQMLAMTQQLLAERFQLKLRTVTREGNVFELVAGKQPKLTPSAADTSYLRLNRNTPPNLPGVSYTIAAQKVTMAQLADELTRQMGRPVLNHTNLTGEFDFKVDFALEGHSEEGPSIFTALQDQLGLRLRTAKGPLEEVVIEQAERPAEN